MTKRDWRIFFNQGIGHFNRSEFSKAVHSFQKAVESGADTPDAHCFLAHSLQSAGKTRRAIAEFRGVIDAHPGYSPARDGLISMLRSLGRMREAASLLTPESGQHPGSDSLRRELESLTNASDGRNYISLLDASAFSAQDVIALLLGDKPVAYNDATKEQLAFIPEWAKQLGLVTANLGKVKTEAQDDKKARYGVLLSKERRTLEMAANIWSSPRGAIEVGKLLGYPDCCGSSFAKFNRLQHANPLADVVPFIAAASGAGPYPFLLNNLLVFNSKRCPADGPAVEKLFRINADPNIALKLKAVITWHPCTYNCRPSLAAARRTWSFLKRHSPAEAASLQCRLDKPVLYLSCSEFVTFEGRADRKSLAYSRVVPPYSLLPSERLDPFRAGNPLRLARGKVHVCRDGKELSVLSADFPRLLPFTPRTVG